MGRPTGDGANRWLSAGPAPSKLVCSSGSCPALDCPAALLPPAPAGVHHCSFGGLRGEGLLSVYELTAETELRSPLGVDGAND
jgi:hypothetical protein